MAKSKKTKGKAKPAPKKPAKAKPAAKAKAKAAPAKKAAPKKAAAKKAAPMKAAPMKPAAKKPAAKKPAAKKPAPMKAAPMKAAPMKAAPMKTAPNGAGPAKAAGNAGPTTSTAPSALDDGWSDVETSAPRPAPQTSGVSTEHREKVTKLVLELYQSTVDPDAELPNALAVDPNDFDLDPSPFYEALEETFRVEDPSKHEFAGYGGTLKQTIDFIAARWKGGEIKTDDAFE